VAQTRRDVAAPDLPPDLEDLGAVELGRGTVLEAGRADSSLVVGTTVYDVTIKECVLDGVDLKARRLPGLTCRDVVFEGCDLAGANLEGAKLTRVAFVRCRMTGAVLSGAELQDVRLVDCTAPMLGLRMAKAGHLSIADSMLREADFYEATLEDSAITASDLSAADFTRVQVPELDLRGSTLDGLVSPTSLRGAVITTDQLVALAPALAVDLGITVS